MEQKLEELSYQRRAIDAVIRLFEGQERNTFENSYFFEIQSNTPSLTQDQLDANKAVILEENGIAESDAALSDECDYCIEMETGTGKTLVYLRTVFELFQHYGFTKFIILVPSIAIREGILATFDTFKAQLVDLYGFAPACFEYDSKKLSRLKHFIGDTNPQIMVMTVQAFASDDRIINQTGRDDAFMGMSYWQALGKTQPVVIMDEPQEGMDTENTVQRLAALNPVARLRYSATHRVLRNLLYRLSPFEAYSEGLVKKIEVLSVAEKHDEATLKIELSRVQTGKGDPKAKVRAWKQTATGFKLDETPFLKVGDNLGDKTRNISYSDYTVEWIGKSLRDRKFRLRFTNGVEIVEGERSADFEGIFRQQLYWLCVRHFQKKQELAAREIKPLSLIFIDRVDNYIREDGIIRRLFAEEYARAHEEQHGRKPDPREIEAVQGYYFAKTTAGEYTDNERSMAGNREIYDEILRDKQKLLSFDSPREFIFSHSALGVGWDNPNIFNIATLNQTYSDIKKRQEIGRGLRICLNQDGQRIYDPEDVQEGEETNLLTVVPNETYETFVTQYQSEIGGTVKLRHTHKGKRKKEKKLKRNAERFGSDSFKAFWNRLSKKTEYTVSFNEEELIARAIDALNAIRVPEYQAEIVLTRIISIYRDQIQDAELGRETEKLRATFAAVDLVEEISENTSLSYGTAFRIVAGIANPEQVARNPVRFAREACERIREIELDEMLRSLTYRETGKSYPLDQFEAVIKTYQETRETPNRGIYDGIIVDSNPESLFAGQADNDPEVVCFLKLPGFYKIQTPIGTYNPDFGVVIRRKRLRDASESEFYFVVETKNTNNLRDLREDERYKIQCAVKHFETIGVEARTPIHYRAPVKPEGGSAAAVRDAAPDTAYCAPVKDYEGDFKEKMNS